jgi:murein DD-endopeptidase MepM/ murein hydrolase activator NlpD
VSSSSAEDRILTARRRLLERYAGDPPASRATELGLAIVSPLEGAPRLATSGIGEDRDGGARRHRGLDIAGAVGEPVRSIADGVVVFAGVDLPGSSTHEVLSPRQSARWSGSAASAETGPGGLFVCVEHSPAVTSCYFHLRRYAVRKDQRVAAGETIGEVGLSGVRSSLPHLHFELHVDDRAENPVPVLGDLVIPPRETVAYRYAIRRQHARLLSAAAAKRSAVTPARSRDTLEDNGASPQAPTDDARIFVRHHGRAGRGAGGLRAGGGPSRI